MKYKSWGLEVDTNTNTANEEPWQHGLALGVLSKRSLHLCTEERCVLPRIPQFNLQPHLWLGDPPLMGYNEPKNAVDFALTKSQAPAFNGESCFWSLLFIREASKEKIQTFRKIHTSLLGNLWREEGSFTPRGGQSLNGEGKVIVTINIYGISLLFIMLTAL